MISESENLNLKNQTERACQRYNIWIERNVQHDLYLLNNSIVIEAIYDNLSEPYSL
jgi:hypothetical protein